MSFYKPILEKLHIKNDQDIKPCSLDARNHYPQIKHHTPPPSGATTTPLPPQGKNNRRVASKPNSVSGSPPALDLSIPETGTVCRAPEPHPLQMRPIQRIAQLTETPTGVGGA